ncbi:MAG TPA: hypothetical protein DCZ11_06665 [Gammaproteobacteria bacterium]|nr:hypothetical protein [Gammaproteobacteria bacterium]MCH78108.1 hypothetical protein [Gammaproteobacteria bacterium]
MSVERAAYRLAGQPEPADAARRVGRGIAAAMACEDLGITDPLAELPLLVDIADAALRASRAAGPAIKGNDIPAFIDADNRVADLIARRTALRLKVPLPVPAGDRP